MSELLYGRHAVLETLRANRRHLYRLWVEGDEKTPAAGTLAEILAKAAALNTPIRYLSGGLFEKLRTERVNAQGVALEVGDYPYVELDEIFPVAKAAGEPPLLLILDHLQDPQNLGTLIRTAEAMAVHGIIMPDRRSARITPAVSNASAGAVEMMKVAQVTNINRTIDELKERNIWVAGLDVGADALPLAKARLDGALALVVGSEGEGLSRLTRERCDFIVALPMYGRIESLNASVAGSIVIHAARAARQ
jgi:23S rRNA (guanosine2251-2'-O)-methyltransferase